MKRRDFLLFKTARGKRIAELSCERLFMRLVDSRLVPDSEPDMSAAEPPRVVEEIAAEQLFADLEQELRGVDAVRVIDPAWLASADVRQRLASVLDAFRAAGGQVENIVGISIPARS